MTDAMTDAVQQTVEAMEAGAGTEEIVIEEVSIDGMCGVY